MYKKSTKTMIKDDSLFSLLMNEETAILANQMDRVLTFAKQANISFLTFNQDSEEDDFFMTLKKQLREPKNADKEANIACMIKMRQMQLLGLIDSSYLPNEIKKKFRATLNIRNEKEYYQQVALITGAAIVFAFAPICFALAATGHTLYATAAAMVGIGLALMSYSKIKQTPMITYAFDALDGPQRNAKAFKQWISDLNTSVTESLPKAKVQRPQMA